LIHYGLAQLRPRRLCNLLLTDAPSNHTSHCLPLQGGPEGGYSSQHSRQGIYGQHIRR